MKNERNDVIASVGKRRRFSLAEKQQLVAATLKPSASVAAVAREAGIRATLALNRIIAAKASTLRFKRPRDFSLRHFDDEGRVGFGEGTKIRLSFQIAKAAGLHLLAWISTAWNHTNARYGPSLGLSWDLGVVR